MLKLKKITCVLILFSFALHAEDPLNTQVLEDQLPQKNNLGPLADLKTKILKPMELRDPFKPAFPEKLEAKKLELVNGAFSNAQTLESLNLDTIVVTGVVILSKTNRRAIISNKSTADAPIVIKEGDKIAEGKVTLKAIKEKTLLFIEEITNVYGQKEILETKVPLSE